MNQPVMIVQQLGKSYTHYEKQWHRFARWYGFNVGTAEKHWVLRGVNFTLAPGQSMGVVGHNGAGKSTLLKMLTGTLQPTEGSVNRGGTIAAILELGMGFDPEMTGRQNARHSASIMGYSPAEIEQAMAHIEDFAEIGEHFDQPLRTYSSGMQMRVAFAVATAWRPDVLIVDEALSVGDTYFQHKSADRIKAFQKQGTSLLLVSHDRTAIQALCGWAILLEQGQLVHQGRPDDVFDYYNARIAQKEQSGEIHRIMTDEGQMQTRSGSGAAVIEATVLQTDGQDTADYLNTGETAYIDVTFRINDPIANLSVGMLIKNRLGQDMFGTNTAMHALAIKQAQPGARYCCRFSVPINLGPGNYSISIALHSGLDHLEENYDWRDRQIVFEVLDNTQRSTEFAGQVYLPAQISQWSL